MKSSELNQKPRFSRRVAVIAALTVVVAGTIVTGAYYRLDSTQERWFEAQSTEYLESLGARTDADARVYYVLASRLVRQGQPEAAQSTLNEAIKSIQTSDRSELTRRVLMLHSYIEAKVGSDADAAAAISAADRAGSDDAEIHLARGALASRRQDYASAISEFTRAVQLNPKLADAWRELSAALISVDEPEQALRPLRAAVTLEPGDPKAHADLAEALGRLGNFAEAARECARAAELAPDNPAYAVLPAISSASSARTDAEYMTAETLLSTSIQKFPQMDSLHSILAGLYARSGNYAQARAELQPYLSAHPNDSGSWLNLSSMCERIGDTTAASAALSRFQQLMNVQTKRIELKKSTMFHPSSLRQQPAARNLAQ